MKKVTLIKQILGHPKMNKFLQSDGVKISLSTLIVLIIIWVDEFTFQHIDVTIFTTAVIVLLLDSISNILKKILLNFSEDWTKLTNDYQGLTSQFQEDWIQYRNPDGDIQTFPVIKCMDLKGKTLKILDNPQNMYQLPSEIESFSQELFAAHSTSTVYNQLNVRVAKWEHDRNTNQVTIITERTTYFYSLLSNRSMDFPLSNGMSIRSMFQYGPFFPSLELSQLSNHLGFNGFLESSDNYFVFVKRGSKNSIGKQTYGNSVGASLKTKYALNENRIFDNSGLESAILNEIRDELKIEPTSLEPFDVSRNVFAAYRDAVEGGKPQLLFYAKSLLTKAEIDAGFKKVVQKKKKATSKERQMLEDGEHLLWIPRSELSKLEIYPEKLILTSKNKILPMVPSASAAVVMLLEYLKEQGNEHEDY